MGRKKHLRLETTASEFLAPGGTEAESRHPRVQRDHMNGSRRLRSVVSCGRGAFSGNRTGVFPRPFLLRPRPFGYNPALRRPPGSLGEASPRAPPCRETCTAPSRMFTSHARRSSLRRKKNPCTLISFLYPFAKEFFLRGRRAVTTAAGNARRRSAVSDVRPKINQF